MRKVFLAGVLAIAFGAAAAAQSASQTATSSSSANMNGTTKHKGVATPPPGTAAPAPKRMDPLAGPQLGNNTPTLPQIARHPTATIGSPVPVAGPGGTSKYPTGN